MKLIMAAPRGFCAGVERALKIVDEEINYSDWKLLGMDYLVTGSVTQGKNFVDVNYDIYDIYKKKKIQVPGYM